MDEPVIDDKVQRNQAVRKRRHGMAFATYLIPFTVVLLCWQQGMIPLRTAFYFAVLVLVINLTILALIQTNYNLKLRDPSLTIPHLAVSPIPMLWVMFFLNSGHARAIFMMFIIVAALYGVLELDIRRFFLVCLWILGLYGILILLLWWRKPGTLDFPLEVIQAIAFIMVMVTTAMLGGFISSLRTKLRKRNTDLREAIEKIEDLVNIDPLTNINNRRRLFDVLSEEVSRYSRGPAAHMSFSLFILDIDQFKRINDIHGHLAGDEILYRIAASISENTRIIDSFGRYGGEEFLMVLPQTPLDGAAVKAERVRQQVEALDFTDIAQELKVTVSIGVAEYRPGEDVDRTLLRADRAMYAAKEKGRNRVETEPAEAAANSQE